jgi:phosphoribulokinase
MCVPMYASSDPTFNYVNRMVPQRPTTLIEWCKYISTDVGSYVCLKCLPMRPETLLYFQFNLNDNQDHLFPLLFASMINNNIQQQQVLSIIKFK